MPVLTEDQHQARKRPRWPFLLGACVFFLLALALIIPTAFPIRFGEFGIDEGFYSGLEGPPRFVHSHFPMQDVNGKIIYYIDGWGLQIGSWSYALWRMR